MNNAAATPMAPRHLRVGTRRWWQHVVDTWLLEQHDLRLLTLAAEAWDRGQAAREQIAREGLTCATKSGGPRVHPCVKVQEQAEISFARLVRELDLAIQPPTEARRPPALRSIVGRR